MKNNPIKLRTVFMGTSSFSAEILKTLLEEKYNVIGVFTQPDKKVGRSQKTKLTPVKEVAQKNNLKVEEVLKFDPETIQNLKDQKPDIIIVVAFGKILPKEVLHIPGFGALNIHTSLLPKYRGPSPVQNAILNGETETGVTLMIMDEGVDSGDIIVQEKIKIGSDKNLPQLMEELLQISKKLIAQKLPLWIERKIEPTKQNDKEASFCQLIERSDGKIFWNEEAEKIYNKFRAFQPWPGVFSFWKNNDKVFRIKLNKISLSSKEDQFPEKKCGEIFKKEEKILIKTGKGIISLEEIQLEGKKNTNIQNFINGYPNFISSILK